MTARMALLQQILNLEISLISTTTDGRSIVSGYFSFRWQLEIAIARHTSSKAAGAINDNIKVPGVAHRKSKSVLLRVLSAARYRPSTPHRAHVDQLQYGTVRVPEADETGGAATRADD